jgi:hypothetical protein
MRLTSPKLKKQSEGESVQANRAMVSQQSNTTAQEREVASIIDGLITQRGYHSAMVVLLSAVRKLADVSSADPLNHSRQRELRFWARAVKAAIERHTFENTFELRISEADAIRARGMGLRLD